MQKFIFLHEELYPGLPLRERQGYLPLLICTRYLGCLIKVSVKGVLALGGHFATLCKELDFYEANFCFSLILKKEK